MVLLCQVDAIVDMCYDDLSAFEGCEVLVGGYAVLVLGEEYRTFHLSYVVVEGSCPDKLCIASYLFGYFGTQVGYLHGVLEGAWRYFGHALQQWVADVAEFYEGDIAGEAEELFEHPEQGVDEYGQHAVDPEVEVHVVVHLHAVFVVEGVACVE